jgi:lysozyme
LKNLRKQQQEDLIVAYTPGVDASRYDGEVDWKKVYAAGYRFAVIRATVGDYYTDPMFLTNWTNAKKAGLRVSAYHVLVATNYADRQINRLFSVLNGRKADFPYVLDIERKDTSSKAVNAACIQDCVRELAKHDKRRPIFYTAQYYWKDYVTSSPDWGKYDLWVASYSSKPYLPSDWTRWKFWQYSESVKVPGMGSVSDVNYFNGSYDTFIKYCGSTTPTIDPTPTTSNLKAKVIVSVLNMRSGPSTSYKNIGKMVLGNTVNIIDIAGSDTWLQVGPGKWSACYYNGQKYMQTVPGNPFKVKIVVDQLNIRSGPGTNYGAVGQWKNGDTASVSGISGKDAWVEYDLGKWSAFTHGADSYMQLV